MTASAPSIALVGRRNAARRAARAMGLAFVIVDPDTVDANGNVDDERNDSTLDGVSAVAAVTEGAVAPAARLRARLGLPGLDVPTAVRCTDKLAMKRAIADAGLPCARFEAVDGDVDGRALIERLGLPLVLKPRVGSGGRGAHIVRDRSELPERVDGPWIAESFVDGVEMSFESLVVARRPVFENLTDYVEPRWANVVPGILDAGTMAAVRALNARVIETIGIERGFTHMEVFRTAGGVVFGEVAARPPGGHIMRLIELAYGFDPWRALLDAELGRPDPAVAGEATRYAGLRYLHPDPGVVRAIHGVETVRSLPGLEEFASPLEPGMRVHQREGAGQHHGYALFAGSEDTVRRGLDAVRDSVTIDMDPTPR